MPRRREDEPFIRAGDDIVIKTGGGMGRWRVDEAQYASKGPFDHRISMTLSRGGQRLRVLFNEKSMQHDSKADGTKLRRKIRRMPSVKFDDPD